MLHKISCRTTQRIFFAFETDRAPYFQDSEASFRTKEIFFHFLTISLRCYRARSCLLVHGAKRREYRQARNRSSERRPAATRTRVHSAVSRSLINFLSHVGTRYRLVDDYNRSRRTGTADRCVSARESPPPPLENTIDQVAAATILSDCTIIP